MTGPNDAVEMGPNDGIATGPGEEIPIPETAVPAGETPAARCPYCDRPFRRERAASLHVVEVHADRCTDAECEAAVAARDEEADELFVYHLKVVGSLSLLYTASVLGYMVVLGA